MSRSIRRLGDDGAALYMKPAVEYRGFREGSKPHVHRVHDDNSISPLPARNDLRNHSPDGFEWGYGGSGPSQLALALLADALGDRIAIEHYQQFKWDRIARLKKDRGWRITRAEVLEWIARRQQEDPR